MSFVCRDVIGVEVRVPAYFRFVFGYIENFGDLGEWMNGLAESYHEDTVVRREHTESSQSQLGDTLTMVSLHNTYISGKYTYVLRHGFGCPRRHHKGQE